MIVEQERPSAQNRLCHLHRKPIVGVCRSALCDHYRQLCWECRKDHDHKEYLGWAQALKEAQELAQIGLRSLQATRARKNAEMQNYIKNNMAITQINARLQEIKALIQEKIDHFKHSIHCIYSEHVKEKLQDLDQIINVSEKVLKEQLARIDRHPAASLAPILTRDLLYELKYYDSYFNEIFIKKTRHFRTALQNDRIFTLIVNFQQNLQKIFTFNLEQPGPDYRQQHIFARETDTTALYTISKHGTSIERKPLHRHIGKLAGLPDNYSYQWHGVPQSVFYRPNNCYYIFGEGGKTSRCIVKWEWTKGVEQGFCNVRPMETDRRNFAVCQLGGEIYVVGGQNDRQGCLSRCEKFVPLCGSQIYIIHSLNSRSSRHSLTTYRDKYILKFGGIKRLLLPEQEHNYQQLSAPPEIYSIETEEWTLIPIRRDIITRCRISPSIFSLEHKGTVLVLGGDGNQHQYRAAYQIILEEIKGSLSQVKVKQHNTKLKQKGRIHNSTIRVQQQENFCTFISSQDDGSFVLSQLKLHN